MPGDPRDTPAMQQYFRFKQRHPGCVLLFRIGDFYEMFDEDAVAVSKAIGLTLTQRAAGVPMAGVPHHQLETYLRRLTGKGFRVAVCEQLVEASAVKGLVPRAVTRVITPGTLVDESLLDGASVAAVAAVVGDEEDAEKVAVAVIDVSVGSFVVLRTGASAAADELVRRGVREVVHNEEEERAGSHAGVREVLEGASRLGVARSPIAPWYFRVREAGEALREQFRVRTLEAFDLREEQAEARAAGALLRHLLETQTLGEEEAREAQRAGVSVRRGSLAHLAPPKRDEGGDRLLIDAVSLRSLEVERTLRGAEGGAASEGTLLGVFLHAGAGAGSPRTAMGKRELREWLLRPLRDAGAIDVRSQGVGVLAGERVVAEKLGSALERVQDVARITGRLALARATPRDVVALARSVLAGKDAAEVVRGAPGLAALAQVLERAVSALLPWATDASARCVEEPPHHLREGGLFRDGVDATLDEARLLERDAGAWLAAYQERLIAEHALPSLRVGYNKVSGYYIELPTAQARTAPVVLKRMQTLRNAERFTTPELADFERKVTTAQSRAVERERELFQHLCDAALEQRVALRDLADSLSGLDALLALADKAARKGWVRPRVVEEPVLRIMQGRHPVLEEALGASCVPNDTCLGAEADDAATPAEEAPGRARGASLALITGPNMAGKSTYIRQTALLTLLAHAGSFVPAESAVVGVCDRIFTRIGADDALHAGQSTFMVEMIETARILHHAGPRSLVVLDEVGRGTSTLDGLSLAWAIAEHLARTGCRALFATHYHELTTLEDKEPGAIVNLHVAVREWPAQGNTGEGHAEIVFLHRILRGRTDKSYGLHVARLAGMPRGVVARAGEVLASLAVHREGEQAAAGSPRVTKPDTSRVRPRGEAQMALFVTPHPAVDALREVKLEELTPLKAFDELRKLRAMLDE